MPFRVATFNAGLAVGLLPYVTERVPRVVHALAALDVDLLFVQELWLDAHWDAVREAVSGKLPHALRPPALAGRRQAACTEQQLAPLVACATEHCAGLRDEALARCVVDRCARHGLALPTDCLNCIAHHPHGTLEEIVAACIGEPPAAVSAAPAATATATTARYGGLMAYGGSFGTGLLSAAALEDGDVLVYDSSINARGALHARVDAGELGRVHVFATHFSPGGAEQLPQVEALCAWVEAKAPRGRREPAILLGDLNTSPGSSLWRRITEAGFREPDRVDDRATFGGGLGTGHVPGAGWRIDHVLLRDVPVRSSSRRVLDEPITLPGGVPSTLSDHLGVLAVVEAGAGRRAAPGS